MKTAAQSVVAADRVDPLWFLGTVAHIRLDGEQTGGRFALWDAVLPRGAAPPLHSHPQDETFYLLEGEVTAWLVEHAGDTEWVESEAATCRVGAVVFAAGGTPHTFRVESDTARLLFLSTPAGIEDYVRSLAEPSAWPWLQPPADGPRIAPERIQEVERKLGIVRHGPPPPARSS
jgi:quercetin dioxygenase-like cupin family protein